MLIKRVSSQRPGLIWLGVIVALAVIARVVYFFVIYWPIEDRFSEQWTDGYWRIAENMLSGRGYVLDDGRPNDQQPTALRPPVTVFFLLPILAVFGPTSLPIIIAQWSVTAATLALLYLAALWSVGNRRAALLAVVIYALYLPAWKLPLYADSEPVFILLLTLSMLAWLKALHTRDGRWFAATGLLFGLSTLSRSAAIGLPAVMLLTVPAFFPGQVQRWVQRGAVMLAAFALAMAPWIARNFVAFDAFVPASTVGGFNLFHDFRFFLCQQKGLECDRQLGWLPDKSEAEMDRLFMAEARVLISRYPLAFAERSLGNFGRFWLDTTGQRFHDSEPMPPSLITRWMNAALLLTAGLGALVFWRRWTRDLLPVAGLLLYYSFFHLLVFAQVRYSQPLIPFLGIIVAATLVAAWDGLLVPAFSHRARPIASRQ